VKAKALFIAQKTAEKENTNTTENSTQAREQSKTHQAANNEGALSQTATTKPAPKDYASTMSELHIKGTTTETGSKTSMMKSAEDATGDDKTPDQVTKEMAVTNNQAPAGTGQLVDMAEPEQAHVKTNDTTIDRASDDPLPEPTAILPKEWQYLHNQWLQSVMRVAMGDTAHPEIPNLADYKYKKCDEPDYEIEVEPPRVYVSH